MNNSRVYFKRIDKPNVKKLVIENVSWYDYKRAEDNRDFKSLWSIYVNDLGPVPEDAKFYVLAHKTNGNTLKCEYSWMVN